MLFQKSTKGKSTTKRTTRKITELKTKTMERKQILEMLTSHCAGVASTKENGLVATKVYLDDLADDLVDLFAIDSVVGQSEQLKCGMNHNEPNCNCYFKHCEKQGW